MMFNYLLCATALGENEMKEPTVKRCTMRDAIDENDADEIHLECRMSDGQKGAFVVVDGDFPELARKLHDFLNADA